MIELIQPVIIESILFFGACCVLLVDAFQKTKRNVMPLVLGVILAAILGGVFFDVEGVFYSGMFANGAYTGLIKISVLCFAFGYLIAVSTFLIKYNFQHAEYLVMLLFMLVGIMLMISANHFIMLYVGMEVQALSAYTLAVMQRKSSYASESGVKYFILGSLSSVVYLFGVSFLYGAGGTLDFQTFATVVSSQTLGNVGVGTILVLSAVLFKMGVVPFHQWVADVYQGAPTPSTALFSSLLKIGAVAVMLRLLSGPFVSVFPLVGLEVILNALAMLSLIWGSVVPIFQTSIKRLLAHGAIGHVGFILLGVSGLTVVGFSAVTFYVLLYALTSLMVFACLMSLQNRLSDDDVLDDISLRSLAGLAIERPKHAFVLAVGFLSMAGLPPLIGFFPKLLILKYVLQQGYWSILIIAVIATVVGLTYTLKLVKSMYMNSQEPQIIQPNKKINKRLFLVFLPLILLHIVGGYLPWVQNFYEHSIVPGVNALMLSQSE